MASLYRCDAISSSSLGFRPLHRLSCDGVTLWVCDAIALHKFGPDTVKLGLVQRLNGHSDILKLGLLTSSDDVTMGS